MVRQRVLNPPREGSNPSAPARLLSHSKILMKVPCIKKKSDFANLSKKGKKIYLPFCIFIYYKNDNLGVRLSFAVSKKVGNAITRNKIKRRIREATRIILQGSKFDLDILIIPKIMALNINFLDIIKTINDTLHNIK